MWPFHRKPPPVEDAMTEATAARIRAQRELEKIRAETPKYRALGESLRQLREANNFASAIETSFRGGRT